MCPQLTSFVPVVCRLSQVCVLDPRLERPHGDDGGLHGMDELQRADGSRRGPGRKDPRLHAGKSSDGSRGGQREAPLETHRRGATVAFSQRLAVCENPSAQESAQELTAALWHPRRGRIQSDLDTIFKAANYEVDKSAELNEDNPLESLTRAEWIEILLRVARYIAHRQQCVQCGFARVCKPTAHTSERCGQRSAPSGSDRALPLCCFARAKFGASRNGNLAAALKDLVMVMKSNLVEDAETLEEPFRARDMRDVWRKEQFYTEPVDAIYRKWRPQLDTLFKSRVRHLAERVFCWGRDV